MISTAISHVLVLHSPGFCHCTLGHPDAAEPALGPPRLRHLHCPRRSRPPRHLGGRYTLAGE